MSLLAFGIIVILSWGVSLLFLILTILFRKRKIVKWSLAGIALIFLSIPFLYLLLLKMGHVTKENKYCGTYFYEYPNHGRMILTLTEDDTSNTFVFTANSCDSGNFHGTWEIGLGDNGDFIDFHFTHNYLIQAGVKDDGRKLILNGPISLGICDLEDVELTKIK